MRLAAALILTVALVGCAAARIEVHPRTARPFPPIVHEVVQIYENDIEHLAVADVRVISEIVSWGKQRAQLRKVRSAAAEMGGTHIAVLEELSRYKRKTRWGVLRVERAFWPRLPEYLRPR